MAVGDGEAAGGIAGNHGLVSGDCNFLDGVDNLVTILVLIQIGETARPAVAFAEYQGLSGISSVCQQFHGNIIRALAVLVVVIRPDLFHRDIDLRNIETQVMVAGFVGLYGDLFCRRHFDPFNAGGNQLPILFLRGSVGVDGVVCSHIFLRCRVIAELHRFTALKLNGKIALG